MRRRRVRRVRRSVRRLLNYSTSRHVFHQEVCCTVVYVHQYIRVSNSLSVNGTRIMVDTFTLNAYKNKHLKI